MYFVRNNPKDCQCERHRLKIPTLGWIRIKEKGYIPTTKDGYGIGNWHRPWIKRFCHCFKWNDIQEHQQISKIKET